MQALKETLVSEIASSMTGKRREKLLSSVAVLNESLSQGAWVPRGKVKAVSGFYQGLRRSCEPHPSFDVEMCLRYGQAIDVEHTRELSQLEQSWAALCGEKDAAIAILDAARPLPKITAIGLSPKVTKTFRECNLDIDVNSIRMAKIEPLKINDKLTIYIVAWSEGIRHGQSRFAGGGCEACGKAIPSGRFVPVEAVCRRAGLVSLWLGCDCARNIFGIQDVGIDRHA